MKKIIDQYTDRKDLSSCQKWKLRHPEEAKVSARKAELTWRFKHPEKYESVYTRTNNKARVKSIKAALESKKRGILWDDPRSRSKRKEIIHLYAKGKSIVDIAMWLNVPMSAVSETIASHQNETPKR